MERDFQVLEEALLALGRFARSLEGGGRAWEEGRKEFFGLPSPSQEGAPREGRFLEWFCLERGLDDGRPLVPLFLRAGMPGLSGGRPAWVEAALKGNRFGFFRVGKVLPGRILEIRLPSGEEARLYWPGRSSETPEQGDTLLGRIYPFSRPGGEDLFFPSPWMILYQGEDLVEALERDLLRARAQGMAGPFGQRELEALLEGRSPGVTTAGEGELLGPELPLPDLLERIQLLFDRFGFVGVTAQDVAREAREAESFAQAFGDYLDQLAFETDVDLEEMRRLFLQLWSRLKQPRREGQEPGPGKTSPTPGEGTVAARPWTDPDAPCPCGSGLPYEACHMGRDLVARLEEAEGKKEKLGPILEGLGRALGGLGDDRGEDPFTARQEGLAEARALVMEFAWEKGLDREGPGRRVLGEYLEHLAGRAEVLPPLRAEDLVGDPAREWILSRFLALGSSPGEARAFLSGPARELVAFGRWLQEDHGLEEAGRRCDFLEKEYIPAFLRALEIQEALSRRAGGEEKDGGEKILVHVAEREDGGGRLYLARGFPAEGGRPPQELEGCLDEIPRRLSPGDLLAGTLDEDGRLGPPFQVIPSQAVPYLRG